MLKYSNPVRYLIITRATFILIINTGFKKEKFKWFTLDNGTLIESTKIKPKLIKY